MNPPCRAPRALSLVTSRPLRRSVTNDSNSEPSEFACLHDKKKGWRVGQPWKVWERMPERQGAYGSEVGMLQVRKMLGEMQNCAFSMRLQQQEYPPASLPWSCHSIAYQPRQFSVVTVTSPTRFFPAPKYRALIVAPPCSRGTKARRVQIAFVAAALV